MYKNNIISIAIHDLEKIDDKFQVNTGKPNLRVSSKVQSVVDLLHTLYEKKTTKSYGEFSIDEANNPTSRHIREYFSISDADFDSFSRRLMDTLSKEAGGQNLATGGHVFFAHFEQKSRVYLMITIVNDKVRFVLTQQNEVDDVNALDIDGFRFAGRVDVTAFFAGEKRFISFLKGQGNVAAYFQSFLGCDNSVSNREETQKLVAALEEFAEERNFNLEQKSSFLRKFKEICMHHANKFSELSHDALANELCPSDPEALKNFLADPERQIHDNFVPNRSLIQKIGRLQTGTDNWSLEMDRQALLDGDIEYDMEDETLLIRNLPSGFKESLARLKSE